MSSTQDRFNDAIKDIRKDGVKVRQNIQKCCRGCIEAKDLGIRPEDTSIPYIYTYGGQGAAYSWGDGNAVNRASLRNVRNPMHPRYQPVPVSKIYWNWGGQDNSAAEKTVQAFRNHGFQVSWDGTEANCVVVILEEN